MVYYCRKTIVHRHQQNRCWYHLLKYKKKDKNRVEEKCLVFDLGTPYIYGSVCMMKNKMKKYKTGESSLQETCTEKISFKCSNNRLNTLTTCI